MRGTQYPRDVNDGIEKPPRTGSPAFAEDDSWVWRDTVSVIESEGVTGIPETSMMESKSPGVLGPPLSRRTTAVSGAALSPSLRAATAPSTPLLRLRAHLHLAVAFRTAFAVVLRAAFDGHRIVRHVLRDDRARTDIGAIADPDRRHQRGIGTNEGAFADRRLVLEEAVIVAGDGAGADVGIGADMASPM